MILMVIRITIRIRQLSPNFTAVFIGYTAAPV